MPIVEMIPRDSKCFYEWATKGIIVSRKILFDLYALSNMNDDPTCKSLVSKYSKKFKKVCSIAMEIHIHS